LVAHPGWVRNHKLGGTKTQPSRAREANAGWERPQTSLKEGQTLGGTYHIESQKRHWWGHEIRRFTGISQTCKGGANQRKGGPQSGEHIQWDP